eukprot:Gb_29274 [translate_table: standard]
MAEDRTGFGVLLLVVGLCINACADATNGEGPTAVQIIKRSEFQQALAQVWSASFIKNDLYQIRGGWVYVDSTNPNNYFVQRAAKERAPQASLQDVEADTESVEIALDDPEKDKNSFPDSGNYKLVADFHTHPFPHTYQEPESDDISRAYKRGVPGVVVSCSGIFSYGPQRRASLDGPTGYPGATSSSNDQSDHKISENTVDSEGHCK